MNLKQLLKNAGVRPDIIKEVEAAAKRTSAEKEQEALIRTDAMAKHILKDVMPHLHAALSKTPPSAPKKTIIVPDNM